MIPIWHNKKKAQTSQMFTYLTTLIVLGLIIFVGTKVIGSVMKTGEEIDYIKFRNTLIDTIDMVASDYNAQQSIELDAPKGVEELCFIDLGYSPDTPSLSFDADAYPIISNYWGDAAYREQYISALKYQNNLPRNVFLRSGETTAAFHIPDLSVPSGISCIKAQRSTFYFKVKSEGRKVVIEQIA